MERVFKGFSNQSHFNFLNAVHWANQHFPVCCLLNSNGYSHDKYGAWPQLLAVGAAQTLTVSSEDAFSDLKIFAGKTNDWLFGFLSYDLKNQLEALRSCNDDGLGFPLMHFFRPIILVIPQADGVKVGCLPGFGNHSDPQWVYEQMTANTPEEAVYSPVIPRARVSKERYLQQVKAIKEHIQLGDIYEMNYCVEFYAEKARIDPLGIYRKLNSLSPTPHSAFYKVDDKYLVCASPERFMKKAGDLLVSQPIKGTAPRGATPQEDQLLKDHLYADAKERSENVMIVDLVRNDLSHVAAKNSVQVSELFGIYSFSTVHQMISTITARLSTEHHFTDALRHAFPMGSMTGAPKIRAMQLIEQYEDTRRGLFSGAVGYITPEGDFDFNVVIRSIFYNEREQYLAFLAGSAITSGSVPEKEYQECLHKANTMEKALR